MNEWCFRPRFCTVLAILGRRQPGRMRCMYSMSQYTILYHARLYHFIPYHAKPHHMIPYHSRPYHIIMYHARQYYVYCTIPGNTISHYDYNIQCHTIRTYHTVLFHNILEFKILDYTTLHYST